MKRWALLLLMAISTAVSAQTGGTWKPITGSAEQPKKETATETKKAGKTPFKKTDDNAKKTDAHKKSEGDAVKKSEKDAPKKKSSEGTGKKGEKETKNSSTKEKPKATSVAVKDSTVSDTTFKAGKVMVHLFIDVSCDSPIHNCDSIQALRNPCFVEFLEDKHNQEDCKSGVTNCTIQIKVLPLLVDATQLQPHNGRSDRLWMFLLLTFQLIVIVYIRVAFYKSLEDTIKAYFNINLSQQLYREQEPSQPFSAFLLNLNFIISISLFTYLLVLNLSTSHPNPLLLLTEIFIGISGLYIGKYLLMRFVSAIFPFKEEMNFYAFNFFINQKLLGVLLIPFNFIVAFSPSTLTKPVIFISIILVVTTLLLRSFRGLVIAKNYLALYKFHFFIYICTLEIAPLAIILKLITKGLHY